jgi:hypothetical protein
VKALSRRGRGLLAAAVGATVLFATGSATPAGAKVNIPEERRGNFFGVVSQAPFHDPAIINRVRRGGVESMRFIVPWSRVEAVRDKYNWDFLDRRVDSVQDSGVVPVPMVFGFPSWMLDTYAPLKRPEFAEEFQEFLRDLVGRYGPNGLADYYSDSYVPLRSWQIWNEVNLPEHLNMDQPEPGDYVDVLRLSAEAIRSVDPGASLIAAGLAPGRRSITAPDFIEGVFEEYRRRGLPPDFNEVGVHPYGSTVAVAKHRVLKFRQVMNGTRAGRRTPILIGELGWASEGGPDEFLGGSPKSQARKLRKSFRTFHRMRHRVGLSGLMWFALDDAAPGTGCSFCPHSGLFEQDFTPKPSWKVFKKVVAKRTGG